MSSLSYFIEVVHADAHLCYVYNHVNMQRKGKFWGLIMYFFKWENRTRVNATYLMLSCLIPKWRFAKILLIIEYGLLKRFFENELTNVIILSITNTCTQVYHNSACTKIKEHTFFHLV